MIPRKRPRRLRTLWNAREERACQPLWRTGALAVTRSTHTSLLELGAAGRERMVGSASTTVMRVVTVLFRPVPSTVTASTGGVSVAAGAGMVDLLAEVTG